MRYNVLSIVNTIDIGFMSISCYFFPQIYSSWECRCCTSCSSVGLCIRFSLSSLQYSRRTIIEVASKISEYFGTIFFCSIRRWCLSLYLMTYIVFEHYLGDCKWCLSLYVFEHYLGDCKCLCMLWFVFVTLISNTVR